MTLILIADDDADIRRVLKVNLESEGFQTVEAADGEEALSMAIDAQPDVILLDLMMPGMDGLEVCRRLRADFRTAVTPVLMLTAQSASEDQVAGLATGADDYVAKPFDPSELIARIEAALRRSQSLRAISPLTGLPGNVTIEAEIRRRAAAGERFAVCHADLDNFKAYNDRYGFLRGDVAIKFLSDVIRAAAEDAGPGAFIGHIGGDDFIILCEPGEAGSICGRIITRFDEAAPRLYDSDDADSGGIVVKARNGTSSRFAIVSVSIGVATAGGALGLAGPEIAARATEMKGQAKGVPGSAWRVDRRSWEPFRERNQ